MFRKMRRFKQQLDRAECEEILATAPRGTLSIIGEDGYPYGVPINFVWWEGKVYFHSAQEGHKVDAIAACDKACFTVLDQGVRAPEQWWYVFRSVIAFGRVRRVEGQLAREALVKLAEKYFPPEEDIQADVAKNGPRVAMYEFTPDHLTGKRVQEK